MSGQHIIQCKSNIWLCLRARTPAFGFISICMVIFGIWLQIWTRLIVNRGISNIITRDPSLVASDYIHCLFPAPGSRAALTVFVSLGTDFMGSMNLIRENDRRQYRYILHTYLYEIISPTTKLHSSMMTIQQIRHMRKLHLHNQVLINHDDAICTVPRFKEEIKRREKQENFQEWFCPPYLNFLTHAPTTIHSRCSDIWAQFVATIIRFVNHLLMVCHRWEHLLPASVVAVNYIQQLRLICQHLTGMFSPKSLDLPSSSLLALSDLCAALSHALLSIFCSR